MRKAIKRIIKKLLLFLWESVTPNEGQDYLLLMGHPRSGSSLLMHILTSNKEIVGFGEYLIKYEKYHDFRKAEFDIRRKANRLFKKYKFVVNQINHHSITPNLELLKSDKMKLIILVRQPEETLSSMYMLSESVNKSMSQDAIVSVYIERLHHLNQIIKNLDASQWTFVTYEDLITDTNQQLQRLSVFLNLQQSLTSSYELKKYTQIWGDPSENIKRGVIFKTDSKQMQFDEVLLFKANKTYQNTLSFLQDQKKY